MLIESEADLSDYKKLIYEEYTELEEEIEEAYTSITSYVDGIDFFDDLYDEEELDL